MAIFVFNAKNIKVLKGIIFLFVTALAFSQGEANIWYFGNQAGLDFNSGSPVALLDCQFNTQEGCAAISDSSGQLLFYTDGITVYNRNQSVMFNGAGLLGHSSSAQSATIVLKPGSTNLYYIFTTDNEHDPNGFRYSVVDMSLDGGLGGITAEKNVLVFAPSLENIGVVKKANNIDYWIVGHGWNSNDFYAYTLTASGLNSTPVTSSVGAVISGTSFVAAGNIKIAPSGSKLVFTSVSDIAQLFDFNSATGVVSNPVTLSTEQGELYGIEFSPSENVLYLTNSWYKVYQYDLTATDIPNSKITLYNGNKFPGALQIGPDGKIYMAVFNQGKIGIITNPDIIGTGCGFQIDAVDLGGKISRGGLPSFNRSFFDTSFKAENLCLGSSTQFDLLSTNNVTGAVWDFGDSSSSFSGLSASHTYASAGSYLVSVTISGTFGTITKSKSITISNIPVIAATIANQSVCGSANMSYSLSQFNNTLLGTQLPTAFGVAYFDSAANAAGHINPVPVSYNLPLGNTTFVAKVYNLSNNNCYATISFTVSLSQEAVAATPPDFLICESMPYDNIETFDLSTKNGQILNGQNPSTFSVTYHASQTDANTGVAALPMLYTNTLQYETIYARVTNINDTRCYDTAVFNLKVIHQPQVFTISNFLLCDDASNDGIANFDLNQKTTAILNGQSPTDFNVAYYYNLSDAQNGVNNIINPINNTVNNQTIYYSITAVGNAGCRNTGSFTLVVVQLPFANTTGDLFICDDTSNDGIGQFDLHQKNTSILGTQNPALFSVSYYLNQNDADLAQNPLPQLFQNTINPQTVFARIENTILPDCFATTNFQIGLFKMPVAFPLQNLIQCDDASNNGQQIFDLSQQTATLLGSQSPANFTVSYHSNITDANLGNNNLNQSYTNISNPQIIYARIENNLSANCFDVTSFELQLKAAPVLTMDNSYSNCEGHVINISAPSGFSTYNWSTGTTTSSTSITTAGNYSLTVTRDYGVISCPTTKNFTVYNSNKATIANIETRDWTDNNNMIIVQLGSEGKGDYEYSIDGIHYQDSNIFENLPSGLYTIYVNDKKGCGEVTEDVFLLMYPKFFTPNGDGFNDMWYIKFSNTEPDMELQIYDRYGKIITIFKGRDFGWDGYLNGKLQVADDYWFVVKRRNGKEFRGHFSLLR